MLECKQLTYFLTETLLQLVPVNKIFLEQLSPEPKVMIPMYEPLETSKSRVSANKVTNHMLPTSKPYLNPTKRCLDNPHSVSICLNF